MEKETSFSELDSLRVIQQMIETARQEQKDNGKGWITWGWMLFLASVFTIINMHYFFVSMWFFWNIFGCFSILFGIYSVIRTFVIKKKAPVKTHTRAIHEKLNIGFFISLMLIIVSINVGVHPNKGFALLMNLYGFWILIYGTLLNFRPSIIGAYITWALALSALFIPDNAITDAGAQCNFQWVMALHAAAVLVGYIIPGHIANRRFNETTESKTNGV